LLRTLAFLAAVLLAGAVFAQQELLVRVEGVEEGSIYFEPVTPKVVVPEGLSVEARINEKPYDGGEVADQGLHTFTVTVSDGKGRESSSTIRFFVLDPEEPGPTYTVDIVRYCVERLAGHPHVTATASSDERFVLGMSHGWPDDPEIPRHELYGFQLTDPVAEGAKLRVVLTGGNHPREQTGSWALHGALDFLVSDDPRAKDLRRWATFLVYPMVNPDGRYIVAGRSNPEMLAEKVSDHNRVWNTTGRFSTIDAFVKAIKTDTGGTTDYLLDFHSAGTTFFFADEDMMGSPFAHAMTALEPEVGPRRSDGHPGMIRRWAMSEEGLSAPFGYTPELAGKESAKRSMEIGRSLMLTFHDLITGTSALAAASDILHREGEPAFGEKYRERLPELKEGLERILAAGDAPVHRTLEAVYELYWAVNDYRVAVNLTQEASELMASAQKLAEQSKLSLAAWLREAIAEQIDGLTELLANPAADHDDVRAEIETLAGEVDRFRYAETAEAAISTVSTFLDEPSEGFRQLHQNGVRRRRDRLVELVETPGAKTEDIRQASEVLDESIATYWQVRSEGTSSPVCPVQIARVPAALELREQSDWKDGLLVNVEAGDGGLVLAASPTLSFDGDGGHVETAFHPGESSLGQQFTWEFWKRYRAFADNTGSSGNRDTDARFYTQLTGSEGGLRTAIGDSYWTSATLEETGKWYHIAIVFDNGEVRTYVDGDLRDTRSNVKFSGESSSPFTIGRGHSTGRWLNGYTREHRIWSIARSQTDIHRNRYRALDGTEEGLIAYWRLDEGEGDTVHDLTGKGNHGTITGATWQARAVPGYRISQPIALAEGMEVAKVVLSWETAGEDNNGGGSVTVLAGLSDAETALPDEWHAVANGKSLEFPKKGAKLSGSYLWIKQELSPRESESPVVVRSLTVKIE
jgi:hypothetical protein